VTAGPTEYCYFISLGPSEDLQIMVFWLSHHSTCSPFIWGVTSDYYVTQSLNCQHTISAESIC
jgi:hypothetical protein